jgi:hypothetical protein
MMQSIFMPGHSPFALLAFMGMALALFLLFLGLVFALATRRRVLAKWLVAATLAGGSAYLGALLLFSFTSREENLRKGDLKYFCEIDCHLAYSLEEASRTKVLGIPPHTAAAGGSFSVVTVKTWFDPRTIASFRGNGPLTPNPRAVFLVDESGRRYGVSPAGQKAFEESRGSSAPLTRILRPGESYTTTLVFDLPDGVRRPRLFLGDAPGIETFLIGHENSLFHKKIYFELPPA